MNVRIVLRTALVYLAIISPGYAQTMLNGSNPREVLEIARSYGSAALETLSNGDPNIIGRIDGIGYALHFLNCTNNSDCTSLNFYTAFAGIQPSLEQMNAWNSSKRFGRAYLDNDLDASVEMDVNLEFGITRANLDANFVVWRLVLSQFMAHIGL